MQWDLLPPLVLRTPNVAIAGMLEPAYDVGGDCFDYALNDRVLSISVMDAMGHGVGAALISALAVGSYRHDRREGRRRDAAPPPTWLLCRSNPVTACSSTPTASSRRTNLAANCSA